MDLQSKDCSFQTWSDLVFCLCEQGTQLLLFTPGYKWRPVRFKALRMRVGVPCFHDWSTSKAHILNFALKNISTAYKQPRFAVEVILVGGDKQQNGTSFSISRSIADQYTPSVFYVDNINFANSNSSQGGYMSWKPVAYTEEERHLANGRMVHQYGLNTTSVGYVPSYSIAHAFYGNLSQLNLSSMNVSFGNDGDGYYAASNYLVWGGLIGYGEAPLDGLSMLILIIISAGLGLPALLILGGGSIICLKKLAKKRNYDKLMVDPGVN
ncbi:putative glycosylated lysosomal membrane protein A [Apostichopus japonicus]|uniref:Putative glycosylated lysosomal membrane protein A n=1 Tax=Stichopus japonicus TaxID=307972 RepID=A0A2G8JV58_STIJA|nr:putative glycosylated lysosomal membrane protein A [Apostichopus japonicus]